MKNLYLWVALLCCGAIFAQEDLTVSVINFETNEPIQDTDIVLLNNSRGLRLEQITNLQGKAVFRSVPTIDGYQVVFEGSANYAPATTSLIDIRSNQNPSVQLALVKSSLSDQSLEEVVISTNQSVPKINRRDAEVSYELTSEDIEEIPVEGRDITRVLYRLPNVTQSTGFFSEAPNVTINGVNGIYGAYQIDGLDNNERFLGGQKFAIPSGFVKDITVLTSNYSAEYGLTGSGVIDVTTKSGTNEINGEAYFVTRPGPSIDGNTDFAQRDLSGNQVQNGFARYQTGVAVGGPIIKDKTFFFIDLEHTTDVKDNALTSPDLGVSETIQGTNYFDYFSAKIDHIWSPTFRSSLRGNVGFVGIESQGGGLEGGVSFPSAGSTQERNSIHVALKNSYSFGKISAESNILYSRFAWPFGGAENPNSPQVTVRNPQDQTIAVLGHPGFLFDEFENTVQFQQKFKYYLENHTIKSGASFISGDHELFGGGNPNGNYLVDLKQAQIDAIRNNNIGSALDINDIPNDAEVINYSVELRPAAFGKTQNITSFYVEDLWSVNDKLNLSLGLRYDYDNLSKGGSDKGDTDNIAPRASFNYELTNNSTIRGGYSIVYDKILYAIYSDALQQNTTSQDYRLQIQEFIDQGILPADTNLDAVLFDGNASANVQGVGYLDGPSSSELQGQREGAFSGERRILNPNGYDNPYQHQFSLGYQLQIQDDQLFFVDLFYNKAENLYRLRNLNAASEYNFDPNNPVIRTMAEADATRPVPIVNGQGIINGQAVSGVARNVVVSETGGRSEYYAASFNYQKVRGLDDYAFRLNYTLSSIKGDTEDINFRAQNGNNFSTEYGPGVNDRRHLINGVFDFYPFKGTTITVATLLQSGQPINRTPEPIELNFTPTVDGNGNVVYVDNNGTPFTTDLNGDGASFGDDFVGNSDRFPGESRNSDRLPWSNTFDVGVQHRFALGQNKLELRADIFNVFNTENLSGYSNNATQSNQIQQGSSASGRFIQRNASPPRQFQFSLRYLF